MSKYPYVFEVLINRGWSDSDLIKLAGGNLLRVFREVETVSMPYIHSIYRTKELRDMLAGYSVRFHR